MKENSKFYIFRIFKSRRVFSAILYVLFQNIFTTNPVKLVSKDNRAYTYLPDSVNAFPFGEKMKQILLDTGYSKVEYKKKLSLGIATIYKATK